MLILGVQPLHRVSTVCGAALLTAAVGQSATDKA
jgi:hypothetical protein